jgi:hypothetical protein
MYRVCWVNPIPPMPRRFRRTVVVFRPAPSPCILRSRVHPIVSFVLLQSAFLQSPARARLRLERLPWGLVPLHDINRPSPHPPGIPCPTSFRPQRFARSRRLPPRPTLRIYFATLPCPGFSLQGLPPTIQPRWFSPSVTLAPLAPPPAGFPAPANVASTSGSCSESWSAVSGGSFRPARHPCPLLRFQLLRALARRPWVRRRAPSARDLHAAGLRVPRVAGPQRIDQSPCCDLSPERPFPCELSDLRSWLPFPERPISSERPVATADGRSL